MLLEAGRVPLRHSHQDTRPKPSSFMLPVMVIAEGASSTSVRSTLVPRSLPKRARRQKQGEGRGRQTTGIATCHVLAEKKTKEAQILHCAIISKGAADPFVRDWFCLAAETTQATRKVLRVVGRSGAGHPGPIILHLSPCQFKACRSKNYTGVRNNPLTQLIETSHKPQTMPTGTYV